MLAFDYPWILAGLPLLAIAAWWLRRRPKPALLFPDLRMFQGCPPGRAHWVRRVRLGLAATGWTALLLAAAGPRIPHPTPLVTEGIAVMFVVDVSGSMFQRDMDWQGESITRVEAATRVLELFIEGGIGPDQQVFLGRAQDLMGLVVAASYPETEIPLTLSHPAIIEQLRQVRPRSLDEGQTNLGDAIAEALARLEISGSRRKVIVLLSDGEHNFFGPVGSPSWSPRMAAQRAADLGVTIHTIDTGGRTSSQPDIRALGQETLQIMARMTQGNFAVADDVPRLIDICHQIDELERQRLIGPRFRRDREVHHYCGMAALLTFASYLLLTSTWARSIP